MKKNQSSYGILVAALCVGVAVQYGTLRAQILDEVWGSGTHVTDRVVDNQVNNLHKKIEPVPDRPRYLIVLRGLGYRFDAEGVTER